MRPWPSPRSPQEAQEASKQGTTPSCTQCPAPNCLVPTTTLPTRRSNDADVTVTADPTCDALRAASDATQFDPPAQDRDDSLDPDTSASNVHGSGEIVTAPAASPSTQAAADEARPTRPKKRVCAVSPRTIVESKLDREDFVRAFIYAYSSEPHSSLSQWPAPTSSTRC